MADRMERSQLPPSFLSDGGHKAPLIIGAYALAAAMIAGAAEPAAGLAVLTLGLLTAVALDFSEWRSGIGEAEDASRSDAEPVLLPPAQQRLEGPSHRREPTRVKVYETPAAEGSREAKAPDAPMPRATTVEVSSGEASAQPEPAKRRARQRVEDDTH